MKHSARIARLALWSAALGVFLSPPLLRNTAAQGAGVDASLFGGLKYRMVGPARGGRVTTVAGHRSQPGTFYIGATGGGVWKTTDYGLTWHPISDGTFETGSIGGIDVAESNPNVVFVGTGSDGIRSNVIHGRGVYKSVDAGKTWTFVGLRDIGQVGDVRIHPTNPDIVFVAAQGNFGAPNAERGVYRTTDGGATWKKILFVSDKIGATAFALNPANPNEMYAGMWRGERKPWTIISGSEAKEGAGIYKSLDGGDTWKKLTSGLPAGLIGKMDIDVSRANPKRVYALIEAPGDERAMYVSDDAGETWTRGNNDLNLLRRSFYYTNVTAHPKDVDTVFVNNEGFYKSTDGGKTFRTGTTPHGDNHALWINPDNPDIMIQSNDGGANVTTNGGVTWSSQLNQPTAEIYQVETDDQFPYRIYGAQQDTGWPLIVPSLPPYAHEYADAIQMLGVGPGCETGPVKPKPGAPHILYGVCKGEFYRMNLETGQEQGYWIYPQQRYGQAASAIRYRMQRVTPFEISPHDPNVIYHGTQYLHRTMNGGQTWETISPDLTARPEGTQGVSGEPITRDSTGEEMYSTLYAIRESRLEKGVIWVGSNDGPVHVSRDNGKTWKNVTPKGMPPGGRVQNIDDSPHRKGSAFVAYYRNLLGDFTPFIYRTDDYGVTWTLLTNGIPKDYNVRVVREDPNQEGLLYAGTEFGMFISMSGGKNWQPFQLNLPRTPITDIKIHKKDLVLSTMGRSFWVMDNLTPLHQIARSVVANGASYFFEPDVAMRLRYPSFGDVPSDPQFPAPGAALDYVVGAGTTGPAKLEIMDAAGKVIRSFEGGADSGSQVTQGMRAPQRGPAGPPRIDASPGAHRFTWDLRHEGIPGMRGAGGPMVATGTYKAKLTIGSWTQERTVRVVADPRVAKDGITDAVIAEQTKLLLDIRDRMIEARGLLQKVKDARAKTGSDAARTKSLDALVAKLETAGGSYPQPMLIEQFANVSRMLGQADQKPGRDAYERYADLVKELDALKAEVAKVGS